MFLDVGLAALTTRFSSTGLHGTGSRSPGGICWCRVDKRAQPRRGAGGHSPHCPARGRGGARSVAAIHVPPSSRRWALRVVTILGGSVLLHRGQAREGKALAGTKGQRGGLRASGAVSGPAGRSPDQCAVPLPCGEAQGVGRTGSGRSPLSACPPPLTPMGPRPAPSREAPCFAGTRCRGREKGTLSGEKLAQRVNERDNRTRVSGVARDRDATRPVSRALQAGGPRK